MINTIIIIHKRIHVYVMCHNVNYKLYINIENLLR